MTQFVGYIGVVAVTITEEPWFDDGLILIEGTDSTNEVSGWKIETHRASFVGAWRKAIKEIRDRGGVIVNRPPTRPRTPKSKYADVLEHVHGNTVSASPVWFDDDDREFKNRRAARRFAKKHANDIRAAWNY